ncbi:hypothetical protein Goshw_022401 [Gossypium schwendimanii]|uniref:Endonuclease/exonuclease/phosphatase domain-containing protein n=1 Tax=Gossypium schwendimanii TaxID=34291 RepID=A0A7J9LQH4_GOSSC|nr:hypothetical protein [Gossypium schwendimanii]
MYTFKKVGGASRDDRRMEAFRVVLEYCQLMDIGYYGVWYIWVRRNLSKTNIRERLDRGVTNSKWMKRFPNATIHHLTYSFSDHCPILVGLK